MVCFRDQQTFYVLNSTHIFSDMESAEGMLTVMKQANLEPGCETYTMLMCGYARRGDKAALERLIKDCKLKDILISDRDFLEVVYAAAINGHEELVDEVLYASSKNNNLNKI